MDEKRLSIFKCKNCKYTSQRKHNLIRHMISKHQDEHDTEKSDNKESVPEESESESVHEESESESVHEESDEEKDICITVTTNEEYSLLDTENRVHVNITENKKKEKNKKQKQQTIIVENHRCNKCKKYFYTPKSLFKHNKSCTEETSNKIIIDCNNPVGKKLLNYTLKKIDIDSQITNDEDNDSFTSEPSTKPFINDLDYRQKAAISCVNFKLFKVKEKLFEIIQFLVFEKTEEDDIDTEKIYRNIYKSVSTCISNILIDEQEIGVNKSIPSSPRSSRSYG